VIRNIDYSDVAQDLSNVVALTGGAARREVTSGLAGRRPWLERVARRWDGGRGIPQVRVRHREAAAGRRPPRHHEHRVGVRAGRQVP